MPPQLEPHLTYKYLPIVKADAVTPVLTDQVLLNPSTSFSTTILLLDFLDCPKMLSAESKIMHDGVGEGDLNQCATVAMLFVAAAPSP